MDPSHSKVFVCLSCFFCFFETGYAALAILVLYVDQTGLQIKRSLCFCISSAGIKSTHHQVLHNTFIEKIVSSEYMCVWHRSAGAHRFQRAAAITGDCELLSVDTVNHTQVFCKGSPCS